MFCFVKVRVFYSFLQDYHILISTINLAENVSCLFYHLCILIASLYMYSAWCANKRHNMVMPSATCTWKCWIHARDFWVFVWCYKIIWWYCYLTPRIAGLFHIGHSFLSFLLHYLTQKEKYAEMWCNFIIRNYIQTLHEIGTIVMSLYSWKISIFSLPISHVKKVMKMSGFFYMCRHKTIVPISSKFFYVVTYYRVTQHCRESFCLSCII